MKEPKNLFDAHYQDLLDDIMYYGVDKPNRTGVNARSVFGRMLRCNLGNGFPILTTKKIHFKSVLHELLWFLRGEGNIKYLKENKVTIWDEWADEDGNLGPVYGVQWRKWKGFDPNNNIVIVDQIKSTVEEIKNNPDSRRLVISAWNPAEIPFMKLPPCHMIYQFNVTQGKLNCLFNMRSIDVFLGLPFNITSYALLTHMMAQVCGLKAGELIWVGGDTHIYSNHFDQVNEQIDREPYELPKLKINPEVKDMSDFKFEDFELVDYKCHPAIKAPIAV